MKNPVISRDEILKAGRNIIKENGWEALSIRNVAAKCNISIGSVYNYFSSKDELIDKTMESIWFEIFHNAINEQESKHFTNIENFIIFLFARLKQGNLEYPNFFTNHSAILNKKSSVDNEIKEDININRKEQMFHIWQHILNKITIILKNDKKIRQNAFDENFKEEDFAEIIFSLILAALIKKDFNPSNILKLIHKTLY